LFSRVYTGVTAARGGGSERGGEGGSGKDGTGGRGGKGFKPAGLAAAIPVFEVSVIALFRSRQEEVPAERRADARGAGAVPADLATAGSGAAVAGKEMTVITLLSGRVDNAITADIHGRRTGGDGAGNGEGSGKLLVPRALELAGGVDVLNGVDAGGIAGSGGSDLEVHGEVGGAIRIQREGALHGGDAVPVIVDAYAVGRLGGGDVQGASLVQGDPDLPVLGFACSDVPETEGEGDGGTGGAGGNTGHLGLEGGRRDGGSGGRGRGAVRLQCAGKSGAGLDLAGGIEVLDLVSAGHGAGSVPGHLEVHGEVDLDVRIQGEGTLGGGDVIPVVVGANAVWWLR